MSCTQRSERQVALPGQRTGKKTPMPPTTVDARTAAQTHQRHSQIADPPHTRTHMHTPQNTHKHDSDHRECATVRGGCMPSWVVIYACEGVGAWRCCCARGMSMDSRLWVALYENDAVACVCSGHGLYTVPAVLPASPTCPCYTHQAERQRLQTCLARVLQLTHCTQVTRPLECDQPHTDSRTNMGSNRHTLQSSHQRTLSAQHCAPGCSCRILPPPQAQQRGP